MSIPLISDLDEAIASAKYYSSQAEAIRQEYGDYDRQLLDEYAYLLIAEYSISKLNGEVCFEYLEQKYHAILQLRSLLVDAQKEAKSVAQKAYREAYKQKMKEAFDLIPHSVREELSVESDSSTGDWNWILEY